MEDSDADEVFAKEIEDELLEYTMKYDHKVEANLVTKINEVQTNSDVEVNITESTTSLGNELVAAESQDTTESSSSFEGCDSDVENIDTFGDSQALPGFHGDAAGALEFDRFVDRFGRMRKKKLTDHWKSYIRPLRWRCKWAELQVRKLESQAELYDRKLEAYNDKKWTQLDNSNMADGTRSLPLPQENVKTDVFRRKTRRRTEATTDAAAYMSRHNLFSYYYENRKCFTEGAFPSNELNNLGNLEFTADQEEILGNDELLPVELGDGPDGDDYLAWILFKIDFLQSEVGNLKSKLYSIAGDAVESFSFAENLDLPPPHSENGMDGSYIASHSTGVPRTGATSYLDVPGTSGRIIGPACYEAYRKSVEDKALIDNQRVKEGMNSFEQVNIQQMPWALNDGSGNTTPPVIAEPDLLADDEAPVEVGSIAEITDPRSTRKRGRKKAATGGRSRRSS